MRPRQHHYRLGPLSQQLTVATSGCRHGDTVPFVPDRPEREALVLRFPPGGPDDVKRIRKEAKWAHRRHQAEGRPVTPWYRLSLWADSPRPAETVRELQLRLVRAAGLNGINLANMRNNVFWWSTAGELYDRGFLLKKDGYLDEPEEHWSVDLGDEPPSVDVVMSFVSAFTGPERTAAT